MELNKIFLLNLIIFSQMLVSSLASQVLVNTEKFEFLEDKSYAIGAELAYDGSFGNSDVHELSTGLFAGYKLGDRNLIRLLGGLAFLVEEKKEIQNDIFYWSSAEKKLQDNEKTYFYNIDGKLGVSISIMYIITLIKIKYILSSCV